MKLTLEQRMAKDDAVHEIDNIMGRYAFYHGVSMHQKCLELHALDTPGVRAEFPFGIFEGREKITELYTVMVGAMDDKPEARAGSWHQTTMTTSVIEIADDLRTAKGVWMCPAHAADAVGPDGKPNLNLQLAKYACDFVQENGEWKIWHFRIFGIFGCPFDKSWVEIGDTPPHGPGDLPPQFSPSRPPHPFYQYWKGAPYPTDEPVLPEPYKTFAETFEY